MHYIIIVHKNHVKIDRNDNKDALLEKNGIVKVYWDDSEKVEQETYENLIYI